MDRRQNLLLQLLGFAAAALLPFGESFMFFYWSVYICVHVEYKSDIGGIERLHEMLSVAELFLCHGTFMMGQSASCERSSPPQTLIQLFIQIKILATVHFILTLNYGHIQDCFGVKITFFNFSYF